MAAVALVAVGAAAYAVVRFRRSRRAVLANEIQANFSKAVGAMLIQDDPRVPDLKVESSDTVPISKVLRRIGEMVMEARKQGQTEISIEMKNAELANKVAQLFSDIREVSPDVKHNGKVRLVLNWS